MQWLLSRQADWFWMWMLWFGSLAMIWKHPSKGSDATHWKLVLSIFAATFWYLVAHQRG